MFQKCLLSFFILFTTINNSSAQGLTFDSYTHQLLFNVYTDNPDRSIAGFLKRYIPSLSGNKNSQPILPEDSSHFQEEIHTYVFTRHPFISINCKKGKLDICCKSYEGTELIQKIAKVQLWFEFDEQTEAEIAFSRLVDNYILLSTDKKFSASNGSQKAEFSDAKNLNGFNRIQFRLTVDNVNVHRYKILFETIGGF